MFISKLYFALALAQTLPLLAKSFSDIYYYSRCPLPTSFLGHSAPTVYCTPGLSIL